MKLYAFDTETDLIQPGLLTPPLVIGSSCSEDAPERLLSADEAREFFRRILYDSRAAIGGANLVYDFGVMAADDPSVIDGIFLVLEEARAFDTAILETLHDNARGHIFKDPNGTPNYYGLAALEKRHLGIDRSADKEDGWRKRYALLRGVPLHLWPDEAVQYPRRDARGTFEVLRKQLSPGKRLHEFSNAIACECGAQPDPWDKNCWKCGREVVVSATVCKLCGQPPSGPEECPKAEITPTRFNVQCLAQEMRAAWALHLACVWGIRTDPGLVPEVVAGIRKKHEETQRRFFKVGVIRVRPCTKKKDPKTGVSAYEPNDELLTPAFLDELEAELRDLTADWVPERRADIARVRKAIAQGRPCRFSEDQGRLRELVEVAYFGDPPLTSGGASGNQQTSISRDTLIESGDELLEEYGEAGPNKKLLSTYVQILIQGMTVPINPSANVMVATQRTSYRKPNLQNLPRAGLIRECFVPRGYTYEETP